MHIFNVEGESKLFGLVFSPCRLFFHDSFAFDPTLSVNMVFSFDFSFFLFFSSFFLIPSALIWNLTCN